MGDTARLRVQGVLHSDGRRSFVIVDLDAGRVHERADRFLAGHRSGTQRTYAYHLVDHLRWLRATGLSEDSVTLADLRRFMALSGSDMTGPFGVPWRSRPLSENALVVLAACVKGYYLDLTTREDINPVLRDVLAATRLVTAADRNRSALGHLAVTMPSNPLAGRAPARRLPRTLPEGSIDALLEVVSCSRDRMIVTWLRDSGMRVGELCGLWFCDLHLRADHPCGERRGPHVHVVKRVNPNGAAAKRSVPSRIVDGVVTGGVVRRVSPDMIGAYYQYLAEDYAQLRAAALTEMVLIQMHGDRAGDPLSPHGVRQMLARASRRAGLARIRPHAFRHTWATALTEATGGNTKAVADEGGWASAQTVDSTYAHLAGQPTLEAALERVWGSSS